MYTNILVPLDGSDLAESALPHAKRLAEADDAILHLVSVVTRHPAAYGAFGGIEQDAVCWLSAQMGQIVNRDFELISRVL